MSLTRITAPAAEPVSLALARLNCRVDTNDKDALFAVYIQSAREFVEGLTGKALITQTWLQKLDAFPAEGIKLLKPPVQAITSVVYVDAAGVQQTMASNAYVLDAAVSPGWLMPADGTTWPATDDVINAVEITFTAGYGADSTNIPAKIIRWMLNDITTAHDNPGAIDPTGKVLAMPDRYVDRLLDEYIEYGLHP